MVVSGRCAIKAYTPYCQPTIEYMQAIRTNFNQKYSIGQHRPFWTNVRLIVTPFINTNADAFEAMTRMGQPFGGNVTSR